MSDHEEKPISVLEIVGYTLAILIPLVGFVIGLCLLCHNNRHGKIIIATSFVSGMAWFIRFC